MADRHDLSALFLRLYSVDESRHVVGPLGPGIDVAPRARAVAMAAQVERVGARSVPRHALRKPFITSGMLAESVDGGESDLAAGHGPGAVGERGAVGGLNLTAGRRGGFRSQGGPDL